MIVKPIKTRIFKENENLFEFVTHYIKKLPERSVVVVTSKIVALEEGRTVVPVDESTREKLIEQESDFVLRTKYTWLTIKDDIVMSSAGIDESNADGKLVMLPKDCFAAAQKLRKKLQKHYGVKELGVLLTDSRLFPLRAGVVGVALGYAGFKGIKSYKGAPDIFGRTMEYSQTDIADGLATAAVLTMGEGNEQQPLALITKAPIEFCEKVNRKELHIDIAEDVYQPLFSKLPKKK